MALAHPCDVHFSPSLRMSPPGEFTIQSPFLPFKRIGICEKMHSRLRKQSVSPHIYTHSCQCPLVLVAWNCHYCVHICNMYYMYAHMCVCSMYYLDIYFRSSPLYAFIHSFLCLRTEPLSPILIVRVITLYYSIFHWREGPRFDQREALPAGSCVPLTCPIISEHVCTSWHHRGFQGHHVP